MPELAKPRRRRQSPCCFCERVETLLGQNHQIRGLAGLHAFNQDGSGGPGDIEFVAGCLLKLWRQFFESGLHTNGAEHFDFRGFHKARLRDQKDCDSRKAAHCPAHDVSPVMAVITCLI
jgi:hypothetical protein